MTRCVSQGSRFAGGQTGIPRRGTGKDAQARHTSAPFRGGAMDRR